MQCKRRVRNAVLVTLGLAIAAAILALLVWKGFSVGCVFRRLTGLLCPGCGNTRATFALLQLDLAGMLRYNLLYPLEVFYLARIYLLCVKNYVKNGKAALPARIAAVDIVCLVCVLLWWVVRNAIGL